MLFAHTSFNYLSFYLISPTLPPVSFLPKIATFLQDIIFRFSGQDVSDESRQEDVTEFIKNPNFAVNGQTYTDQNRQATETLVIFQTQSQDKPLLWYHGLNVKTRAN